MTCFGKHIVLATGLGLVGAIAAWAENPEAGQQVPGRPMPVRTDSWGDPLPEGAIARLGTMRLRHPGAVRRIDFTPDGKELVSLATWGYGQSSIRVWDVGTGRLIRQFEGGRKGTITNFSPDGRTVALQYGYYDVKLWDVVRDRLVCRFQGLPLGRESVVFSPDGKIVTAYADTHTLHLRDAATGKDLRSLEGDPNINLVIFSPDSTMVTAVEDKSKEFHVWSVSTGKQVQKFEGHQGQVYHLAFSPDGKTLASSSYDKTVRLWNVETGKELWRTPPNPRTGAILAFGPDGKTLLSFGVITQVLDSATGQELRRIDSDPQGGLFAVAPHGGRIALFEGGALSLRDLATGKPTFRFGGHAGAIQKVALAPDGRTLASTGIDHAICFWELGTGREMRRIEAGKRRDPVFSYWQPTFTSDGKVLLLASAGIKSSMAGIDVGTGKAIRALDRDFPGGGCLTLLAPEGKALATVGIDNTIVLWDLPTGKQIRRLPLNAVADEIASIDRLASTPDHELLAVYASGTNQPKHLQGRSVSSILLLETRATRLAGQLQGHAGDGRVLRFSPDGRTLAAVGSGEAAVTLWELASQKVRLHLGRVSPLKADQDAVECADFSPDGRFMATGAWDQTLRLWDLASGQEIWRYQGQEGIVHQIAFTTDGRKLVSLGYDGAPLVWDVPSLVTGKQRQVKEFLPDELEKLWKDLADYDSKKGYRAIWDLATAPRQSVALIARNLEAVHWDETKPQRIAQLIADLDSNRFAERKKASERLEFIGSAAAPALRKALSETKSAEVRRRIEAILSKFTTMPPTPERLRVIRAIEVLEHIGTAEARQILGRLGQAAVGQPEAEDARAAIKRMERRQTKK